MPLKLKAPQPGRTPYYQIRGTYLGVYVEQSAGTGERAVAQQLLRKKKAEIESGAVAKPGGLTFAEAAINYMTAGGERRGVGRRDQAQWHSNDQLQFGDPGWILCGRRNYDHGNRGERRRSGSCGSFYELGVEGGIIRQGHSQQCGDR